jgi:Zn-dependent peptidase ImmA (M78 family)
MSFILSQILKKKVGEWNSRVLTEADFDEICAREKLRVLEAEIKAKGEYGIYGKTPVILLRRGLRQPLKLWVGMHELGHHLLHYPVKHRFSRSMYYRIDREANYFAAIALMPTALITTKTVSEIVEEYNYPKQLIEVRQEIYERYRI